MKIVILCTALLLIACQATTSETNPTPSDQTAATGPTRQSVEHAAPTTPIERALGGVVLSVRPVTATEAEDGRGRVVPASTPVAIDLERDGGWPGRAGDPVLSIGDLRFYRYTFPTPTTLRYITEDPGPIDASESPVALQFGDDVGSRITPEIGAIR